MKIVMRILFLAAIAACAVVSANIAVRLYRDKYAPRYLKGNAC